MNTYTISLFGHRILERPKEVEERLFALLRELFSTHEYLEFLIGRNGEFDLLAASVIKRLIRAFGDERAALVLILPYPTAEWRKNERDFLNYYTEVEIFEQPANQFYKRAIGARNRQMVDRSNLVVCWLEKETGGVFQTIRYAESKGHKIRNLAGEAREE